MDVLAERVLTETRTLFRFDELHFLLVDRDQRVLDVRVHEREVRRQEANRVDAARYLTRTMQRKLSVLRTAATMASRS